MTIRTAVEGDAETIAALSGQLGYPTHPSEVQDRLQRLQARGDGEVFVAEEGGTVAGWVHVYGSHILEAPAHAEIGGLVVDERHRGRGIGRDLMAAAERWAASAGYASVRVRSNVIREAAHEFYRRLGYSETKRQAVFSKSGRPVVSSMPPPPSIPRVDGLLEASLYVEDLKRAAAFYQSLLGFEIVASDERLCALGVGARQVLLLFRKGASAALERTAHDGSGQQHIAFAIPASDLELWTARLREQGVSVEYTRRWPRSGVSLYFRDPDGHLLELATPGVWSIY